jgi:NitT/TauT family transport system substrate-binding protein
VTRFRTYRGVILTCCVVLLVCALVVGALAAAKQPVQLRVGTWKTAQTIQPFFYEKYLPKGSKVTVSPFTNPGDMKTALLAGSLDITGTTIVHAITSASRGEPVVVVSALCEKCSAIVARKDEGINSIKDLRGKRIGHVPTTMHDLLLRESLTKAGLDPNKDVTLVRVDFFDMGQALANKSIDAFSSGEPYPTLAAMQGYGKILAYPYHVDTVGALNAGMLTTRDMIAKHRDQIQAAVTAHVRATQYLQTHQKEWLKAAEGFGNKPDVLARSAKNMELSWDMNAQYLQQARALGQRMQAQGIITSQPDYNKLFDTSFVTQAKRELAAEKRGRM